MVGINWNTECPVCGHIMSNHQFKEVGDKGHSVIKKEDNVVTLSKDLEVFIRKTMICLVPECEQNKEVGYCYIEGC